MTDVSKTVEDWSKRAEADGLTGGVTVITDIDGKRQSTIVDISDDGGASKTKIPRDLLEHVAELLRERDRLVSAVLKASMETLSKEMPSMASLRESCLKIAIDTLHAKYAAPQQEASNG